MRHTRKNAPHPEKCGTRKKMRHRVKKSVTLGKMRNTFKNAPQSEECSTHRKMRHNWKNAPHF